MPVVTLTNTSGSNQTWTVPSDLLVGNTCTVEAWGAGSGGSGAGAGGFGSGGAGGAYASETYTITPNDISAGVPFFINTGSAGTANANSVAGPNTFFSTNNINLIPSTIVTTAVTGSPGTLPPNWYFGNVGTLTTTVLGFGTDPNTGLPYIDIRANGTTSTTNIQFSFMGNLGAGYAQGGAVAAANTQYTFSFYAALIAGSASNITHFGAESDNSGGGYTFINFTPTATYQRFSWTNTWPSTPALTGQGLYLFAQFSSGVAVDFTLRIGAGQIEQAASASPWKSTPGYVLGAGGGPTTGTTTPIGGVGGTTASSTGATKFAGGSGATKAQGGGGGGSAGKDGAGGSSTTATGATGDNALGGAAGVSNVEGGGGGTASSATGGTGGAGGAPGAGGGAETGTSGTRTGGSGGRGQIRITYTSRAIPPTKKPIRQQRHMLLR